MITYTTAVKNSRLTAVLNAMGTTAVLEIGTAGMGTVLATIPLANPAGSVSAGVLTFTTPVSDTAADATGTAAAARIRTASGGTDVITGLTAGTSGTDIILDSASITTGQTVSLTAVSSITHA